MTKAALLITLLAVTVAVYLPGLGGPLLLDDIPQLNDLIARSADNPSTLFNNFGISTSGAFGRPVAMATFIFDTMTHGPDTWWWKYNSLMLHLITGLLLVWLVAALTSTLPQGTVAPWVAGLVVGGLWLLHPLQVSTVLYVVQRMTILSTLFVFAGLLVYVKGRLRLVSKDAYGWIAVATSIFVFVPLAALSKENGVLLLVYISLAELLIFRFRGGENARAKLRMLHVALAAIYLGGVLYLLVNPDFVLGAYEVRDFSLLDRMFTQFRVLANYLLQLTLPLPLLMGFFHDDIRVSTGLFNPPTTLLSLSLIVALISGAIAISRRAPLIAFGILFFFASHALESSIIGLELMYEHRNYTGSAGFLISVAAAAPRLMSTRMAVLATALILCAGLSLLTWQRATIWSTPGTMYGHMYAVHPQSRRLNLQHAEIYASLGKFDHARKALARVPSSIGRVMHELYLDCLEFGHVDDASLDTLHDVERKAVNPHTTSATDLLINAVTAGSCSVSEERMLDALDLVLASTPHSSGDLVWIHFAKARLLESMGRVDDAVAAYEDAQRISDIYAVPLYLAADTLARGARPEQARVLLERAAAVERYSRIVRKDLAERIYAGIGDFYVAAGNDKKAAQTYREAIRSMPDNPRFYVKLAERLLQLGRYEETREVISNLRTNGLYDSTGFNYRIGRIEKILETRAEPSPLS